MESRLFEVAGIAAYPTRADWDRASVDHLGAVVMRWGLTPGAAYTSGFSGVVLSVTQPDGSPAVLKVGFPHAEAVAEAVALQSYPSGTAPRILKQDPWAWAMLLEKIDPGTPLSATSLDAGEAIGHAAALLARISAVGPRQGIPELSSVVHGYAAAARARFDGQRDRLEELGAVELVAEAVDELDRLASDSISMAMVHGDFNPGNVLRSGDHWVAIDPKPMIGDPSYDLWPLVSQLGSPFTQRDPVAALAQQITDAASIAGCDSARAVRWSFARSGLNVTWYLEERNLPLARQDVAELRVWTELRQQITLA